VADQGQQKLGEIIGKCWKDAAFKKRFISDPKSVLKEYKVEVPPNVQVKVVENTGNQLYITLPPPPEGSAGGMSDAQLEQVSGGVTYRVASLSPGFHRMLIATKSSANGSTCYKDCIPW
jgi:hypothetical protein